MTEMEKYLQELQQYLKTKERTLLQELQNNGDSIWDKITARMTQLVEETKTVKGKQQIEVLKKQAYKDIQKLIQEDSAALYLGLFALFFLAYKGHAQALIAGTTPLQQFDAKGNWEDINRAIGSNEELKQQFDKQVKGKYALEAIKRANSRHFIKLNEVLTKFINDPNPNLKEYLKEIDSHNKKYHRHLQIIVNQELHRVNELAKYESARLVERFGFRLIKTWNTQHDDRVRNTVHASHVAMDFVEKPVNSLYDLVPNGTTPVPTMSGIAAQDCNCRCYCTYRNI